MSSSLETAKDPEKLERIVINPLTRVEGHGKVTLLQDENHLLTPGNTDKLSPVPPTSPQSKRNNLSLILST